MTRGFAATIDLLVTIAACIGAYLLLSGVLFLWRPGSFSFPSIDRVPVVLFGGVVFIGYLTVAWAISGRTLGNTVMGLRVLTRQQRRLSGPRSALRALLYAVFPLGLLVCAAGARRSSLQDLMLRTTVVYDWRKASSSLLASWSPDG